MYCLKVAFVSLCLCWVCINMNAQCQHGSVLLSSQAEVDSFKIQYGDCLQYKMNLTIQGADIVNLDSLSGIQLIDGFLTISNNPLLNSLSDLAGLTSLSSYLYIKKNPLLTSINALSNLRFTKRTSVIIDDNDGLTSLNGMQSWNYSNLSEINIFYNSNLTDLYGLNIPPISNLSLKIEGNENLTSIAQLAGVVQLNYLSLFNTQLQDLLPLQSLTSIEGIFYLAKNDLLASCNGLSNLQSVGALTIGDNLNLVSLSALSNMTIAGYGGPNSSFLAISDNPSLINLSGLESILNIRAWIEINNNQKLQSTIGLMPNGKIGSYVQVRNNPLLADIQFLNQIDSIGGSLAITLNSSLPDVYHLSNLRTIAGSLSITDNSSLTDCTGICNFLQIGTYTGSIFISNNPNGCSSQGDIETKCPYCASAIYPTNTWIGGAGDWNSPSNWSLGMIPRICDRVIIPAHSRVALDNKNGVCHTIDVQLSALFITLRNARLDVYTSNR